MIEFALTFGLLVMCIMASVAAAVWSVESEAAVTGAELAARLSISTLAPGSGANVANTAAAIRLSPPSAPVKLLRSAMFGTTVTTSGSCPGGAATYPPTVTLCASQSGAAANLRVTVRVYGCARAIVPSPFGGCPGGVIIDQLAVIHPPVFQQ